MQAESTFLPTFHRSDEIISLSIIGCGWHSQIIQIKAITWCVWNASYRRFQLGGSACFPPTVLSAMSPQTLNPKRLNLAFREWSVSGNCSHPVYVGDFQTSNRNLLLSPLVESAFSGSADHTVIVWRKKETLRVGHSLGRILNKPQPIIYFKKLL